MLPRGGESRGRDTRSEMRARFGVNRAISGSYDDALAARCANGVFVGRREGRVTVWRGIPFALPPTGTLRWKAPEPVRDDSGVYEAYYNGRSPIQTVLDSEPSSFYPQGED